MSGHTAGSLSTSMVFGPIEGENAKAHYHRLAPIRENFLERARQAKRLTLDYLLTEDQQSRRHSIELLQPWSSIGARGVTNLASKLVLALLPVNVPFVRLKIDQATREELEQVEEQDESVLEQVEQTLSKAESAIIQEIEASGTRVKANEAMLHLVVIGNVLMRFRGTKPRIFHLDSYVVERAPDGELLTVITRELVPPQSIPDSLKDFVAATPGRNNDDREALEVYTKTTRKGKRFEEFQELEGRVIPGTEGEWPEDEVPLIALRLHAVDGEDYGHSQVEQVIGDLRSMEGITQAMIEGGAAAAKLLFLCDPTGTTRPKDLKGKPNGHIAMGRAEDVTVVQAGKSQDLGFLFQLGGSIEQRLGFSFLLNSTVTRNAERVTAEEIRLVASELDDALGGVFSLMSEQFQLPLVKIMMAELKSQGRLPNIPKDRVVPVITTGLDAIGRGHELARLDRFVGGALQTFGPQVLTWINMPNYLSRRAAALGIGDTKGLVKSEEEVAEEQNRQTLQALTEKLGPEGLRQLGESNRSQGQPAPANGAR